MSDVYKGEADARQSAAATVQPEHSLFRKRHRQLGPEEVALHDADRRGTAFEPDFGEIIACRKLGTRHLEDAVYRAVKALTA